MGRLIPAGTGYKKYQDFSDDSTESDTTLKEAVVE